MKNIYYIFLLAFAALLAGCERHPVDPGTEVYPGAYIFLDAKVVNTKSNLYDEETLPKDKNTSFGVFGIKDDGQTPIFDNYTADENSPFDNVAILYRPKRPSGSGPNRVPADFIYDHLALWGSGENSFYAYYINGSEYHGEEFDDTEFDSFFTSTRNVISDVGVRRTSSKVYMEYNQPNTFEKMVDVMTAKTTTPRCDVVDLEFEHRLFAIDVVVRNNQIEDNNETVGKAFTFSNPTITFRVPSGGDLYFDDENSNSLNADSLDVTYTFVPADGTSFTIEAPRKTPKDLNLNGTIETSITGRAENNPFLFLPCESLRVVGFSLTFENSWGESATPEYSWKVSPEGGFKPGHKYQLIIQKNHYGSEFEFVPQIAVLEYDEDGNITGEGNWNDKGDVDHTFN